MNIAEALAKEIERNRELLEEYKQIPTGMFGATVIDIDIKRGVEALASGDAVKIIAAYKKLRYNK